MNPAKTFPFIAAAAALALPAAASADTLVTADPGATNLASGGGYLAWSAPADDGNGHELVLRAPDGSVSRADIPRSDTALDPAIGSSRHSAEDRRVLVLYARDGDIHQYDVAARTESKVPGASSAAYREASPGISYGRVTFVRTGGGNNGIFVAEQGRTRKISGARPSELVFNGSRVAYPAGRKLIIRRVSGRGRPSTVRAKEGGFGLLLTRYSLTFLTEGGAAFQTPRFGGSSGVDRVSTARPAGEQLPATTNSIATDGTFVRWYLDGEGLKRIRTQNIFRP